MSGLSETPKMYLNGYLSSENGPLCYPSKFCLKKAKSPKYVLISIFLIKFNIRLIEKILFGKVEKKSEHQDRRKF